MAKISSPSRMKILRKIGVSLWPWRHMTFKQLEKLDKIVQKQSKQTILLERKKKAYSVCLSAPGKTSCKSFIWSFKYILFYIFL
jgi:hypothetical protein